MVTDSMSKLHYGYPRAAVLFSPVLKTHVRTKKKSVNGSGTCEHPFFHLLLSLKVLYCMYVNVYYASYAPLVFCSDGGALYGPEKTQEEGHSDVV